MINSCSILIRKPLGQEQSTLGIRAAWAMLSNADIDTRIIAMGDGIYSLLGKSGYIKELYGKFLAEDGKVYVVKEDMEQRGLDQDSLPENVEVIPASGVYEILEDTESVMSF